MGQIKIFGLLAIFLLLITIPNASALVIVKTDKLAYGQGEQVKFVLTNYNNNPITIWPYTIEIQKRVGLSWVTVYQEATACAAVDGYDCGVSVPSRGSYSYIWDQKIWVNEQEQLTDIGTYRGIYNGYRSNTFRIKVPLVYAGPEPFTTAQ